MTVVSVRRKASTIMLLGGMIALLVGTTASFLALVRLSESGGGEIFVLAAGASSVLCSVGLVVLFAKYWRRLDEAAREAQKAAWLWGAPFGYAAFMLILIWPGAYQMGFEYGRHGASDVVLFSSPFIQGAIAAYAAQILGWLVAWGIWWLRKR